MLNDTANTEAIRDPRDYTEPLCFINKHINNSEWPWQVMNEYMWMWECSTQENTHAAIQKEAFVIDLFIDRAFSKHIMYIWKVTMVWKVS